MGGWGMGMDCRECGAAVKKCSSCEGSGESWGIFGGDCAYCRGTGQQCARDWEHKA